MTTDPVDSGPPSSIILESDNSKNLSADELGGLVGELEGVLRDAGQEHLTVVGVAHEPRGAGNNWVDVLAVFLPSAEFVKEQVFVLLLPHVVTFMRKRFLAQARGDQAANRDPLRPGRTATEGDRAEDARRRAELAGADGRAAGRAGARVVWLRSPPFRSSP